MTPSSDDCSKTAAHRLMQGRFRDYMVAEIACMCEEVGGELPDDPEELNRMLMAWIEKNAQRFRDGWVARQPAGTAVN